MEKEILKEIKLHYNKHFGIMINVKNMFSDKYQDDDLMQEICIAYEKIPEKIKIVL